MQRAVTVGSAFLFENRAGYKRPSIGHAAVHFYFGPKSFAVQTILSSFTLFLSIMVFAASTIFLSNGNFVPV
jgi:hypothetical protein